MASISLLFLALASASVWMTTYNGRQRSIFQKSYAFTEDQAEKYRHHPKFLFLYGLNAWFQNDSFAAARFFRRTVLQDVFHMDAWIMLSQAELALGNRETARSILAFMDPLTKDVYRWKWRQTLLAYDLGATETVIADINFLVRKRKMVQDALQLLDTLVARNMLQAVEVLDKDNLVPLLLWLMRWQRPDDAEIVWKKMARVIAVEKDLRLKYVHFLISQRRVKQAADIWRAHNAAEGLVNQGFETALSGVGFDWRYTPDSPNKWSIHRTMTTAAEGKYSLKILFEGKQNMSFAHLYQIVKVDPLQTYRLTYQWRSKNITTDQGPFIDIYGYDCKGVYNKGPMMLGTNEWKKQDIEFTVPQNCNAVIVRLRRQISHRFDNKISGVLWLDNFILKVARPQHDRIKPG